MKPVFESAAIENETLMPTFVAQTLMPIFMAQTVCNTFHKQFARGITQLVIQNFFDTSGKTA